MTSCEVVPSGAESDKKGMPLPRRISEWWDLQVKAPQLEIKVVGSEVDATVRISAFTRGEDTAKARNEQTCTQGIGKKWKHGTCCPQPFPNDTTPKEALRRPLIFGV